MSDPSVKGSDSNSPEGSIAPVRYREAYQRALPRAQALEKYELAMINIDIPSAVTTALGVLPKILELRDRAAALPEFDITPFDELGMYARATMHAHGEYLAASSRPEALIALNAECRQLRDMLYSDAAALAKRGLINGAPLADFKKATGYKNVATDLVGLASLLRNHWNQIASKSPLTLAELERAEELSEKLVRAVGARKRAPLANAEANLLRQRMFTLFVRAYDEVRRAIGYLRWRQGDLDSIAPSLYAGRGGSRRKSDRRKLSTSSPSEPAIERAPTEVVNPSSSTNAPPVAAGMPDSSRFSVN